MRYHIPIILLTIFVAAGASATEIPTIELGNHLFHSVKLGTNGKSCASCHADGKGLGEIDAFDDGQLKEMVNFCIRDALKGKMMDLESTELDSFLLYLRSLKK